MKSPNSDLVSDPDPPTLIGQLRRAEAPRARLRSDKRRQPRPGEGEDVHQLSTNDAATTSTK